MRYRLPGEFLRWIAVGILLTQSMIAQAIDTNSFRFSTHTAESSPPPPPSETSGASPVAAATVVSEPRSAASPPPKGETPAVADQAPLSSLPPSVISDEGEAIVGSEAMPGDVVDLFHALPVFQQYLAQPSLDRMLLYEEGAEEFRESFRAYQAWQDVSKFFKESFAQFKERLRPNDPLKNRSVEDIRHRIFEIAFLIDDSGLDSAFICRNEEDQIIPRRTACKEEETTLGYVPQVVQVDLSSGLDEGSVRTTEATTVSFVPHVYMLGSDFEGQRPQEQERNASAYLVQLAHDPFLVLPNPQAVFSADQGINLPRALNDFYPPSVRTAVPAEVSDTWGKLEGAYLDVLQMMAFVSTQLAGVHADLERVESGWSQGKNTLELLNTLAAALAYEQVVGVDVEKTKVPTADGETLESTQFKGFRFADEKQSYPSFAKSKMMSAAQDRGGWRGGKEFSLGGIFQGKPVSSLGESHQRILRKIRPIDMILYNMDFHLDDPTQVYLSLAQADPRVLGWTVLLMREALRSKLTHALVWYNRSTLAALSAAHYAKEYQENQRLLQAYLYAKAKAQYDWEKMWLRVGMGAAAIAVGILTAGVGVAAAGGAMSAMCAAGVTGGMYSAAGYGAAVFADKCYFDSYGSSVAQIHQAYANSHYLNENVGNLELGDPPPVQLAIVPAKFSFPDEVFIGGQTDSEVASASLTSGATQGATIARTGEVATEKAVTSGVKEMGRGMATGVGRGMATGVGTATVRRFQGAKPSVAMRPKVAKVNKFLKPGLSQLGIGIMLGFVESYLEAGMVNNLVTPDEVMRNSAQWFSGYSESLNGRPDPDSPDALASTRMGNWKSQLDVVKYRRERNERLSRLFQGTGKEMKLVREPTPKEHAMFAEAYAELFSLRYNWNYWQERAEFLGVYSYHHYVDAALTALKYYMMLRRLLCSVIPGENPTRPSNETQAQALENSSSPTYAPKLAYRCPYTR